MRSTTWQQALELQLPSFWLSSCPHPCALLACVPLVRPLLVTCCFRTLAWMPKVLPLASGSFCSRSRAQLAAMATLQVSGACGRNDGNAAGQRRVRAVRRLQVISTWYPFRVDAGFLVRKRWEWTGFLARRAVRAWTSSGRTWSAPDASLIFSPSLNNLPEKRAKSELFAGFSHHV